MTMSTTRLNLDLSSQTRNRLERLKKQLDYPTYVQTVSVALAVLDRLVTAQKLGQRIVIQRSEEEAEIIIIGL